MLSRRSANVLASSRHGNLSTLPQETRDEIAALRAEEIDLDKRARAMDRLSNWYALAVTNEVKSSRTHVWAVVTADNRVLAKGAGRLPPRNVADIPGAYALAVEPKWFDEIMDQIEGAMAAGSI